MAQWRWRSCKQDQVAQGANVLTPRDGLSKPGTWTRDSPPMITIALGLPLVKAGQLTYRIVSGVLTAMGPDDVAMRRAR